MVDLEDLDVGQLRQPPSPVVQASTNDHHLRHRMGADGIVDGDRPRDDDLGAGPHHLELDPRAPALGRDTLTHPSQATRSSPRSNAIAIGSANRPSAMRPWAAARPWQTSTAVRLARSASMAQPSVEHDEIGTSQPRHHSARWPMPVSSRDQLSGLEAGVRPGRATLGYRQESRRTECWSPCPPASRPSFRPPDSLRSCWLVGVLTSAIECFCGRSVRRIASRRVPHFEVAKCRSRCAWGEVSLQPAGVLGAVL